MDEVGQLLPQWHIPLKARLLTDKPLPYEFSSIVSERIYDAIVSLEPHAHIFIPIDATRPDERVERHYFMFMGDAFFWDSPPILHPEKNALEIIQYSNGTNGYADAPWVSSFSSDRYHFGYLNSQAIEGRHLFASSMLGNERVFSDVLIDKLREFGDIFDKSRELVSIGVA